MERLPPEIRRDITKTYLLCLEVRRRERILEVIKKTDPNRLWLVLERIIERDLSKAFEIVYPEFINDTPLALPKACKLNRVKMVKVLLQQPIEQVTFVNSAMTAASNKSREVLKLLANDRQCKLLGNDYKQIMEMFISHC